MAERYHHGPHDERSERSRRHKSMYASGMIDEDHSAVANLPQDVKMSSYPRTSSAMMEDLDDTLRGIDKQMGQDSGKARGHMKPHKY